MLPANKITELRKILLFIWLATAIGSSLSYDVLAYAPLHSIETSQTTSDEDDQDVPAQEYSYQIVKNISPNLQVDIHPDLYCEFELPLILDNTHSYNLYHEKESEEYFKTLFHFIISPNAP